MRVSLERAGEGQLRIKVADTGIGLTEEQRERLFQPFVQADSTTTRRFGGTGLGLSIVRRLAEAMGGSVAVDSVLSVGSTFSVALPLEAAPEAAPAVGLLDGLSLVLSLPDADEARAIARYLEDAGARVVAETTGAFIGIRLLGSNANTVPMLDAPGSEAGLARPWRRDALVRAVARAFGRGLAEVAVQPAASRPPLGGRVLVVDDNSVNRRILARQLELAGAASTDTAAGGEEALELMRRSHYDLVLADLQMPGMDGFDLARRIRAREREARLQRTPILAITASALEDHETRTREVGMDGLVTKPVGIEELRATLDTWLKDVRVERAA